MDFQQAQARFEGLEAQLRAGQISPQQYQAGLNELRVMDAWGRLWMPQAHTGIWHVFQNGAWVAAQPPVPVAAPPPAYAPPPVAQVPPPASKPDSSLAFKYFRFFVIWAVTWVLIAGGYWLFYGSSHQDEAGEAFIGIGVAAALSLVLLLFSLRGGWKGQVVEIRVERKKEADDDGFVGLAETRYAMILQPDGRVRKERAMPNWQVGDWLEKKQGENWVRWRSGTPER